MEDNRYLNRKANRIISEKKLRIREIKDSDDSEEENTKKRKCTGLSSQKGKRKLSSSQAKDLGVTSKSCFPSYSSIRGIQKPWVSFKNT